MAVEGQDSLVIGTVGPPIIRAIFGLKKKTQIVPSDRLEEKLTFGSAFGPLVGPGSEAGVALSPEILEALRDDIIAHPGLPLDERSLRNAAIINAMQAGGAAPTENQVDVAAFLHDELAEFLDFTMPLPISFEGLLEKLSKLLLQPTRAPGEKCLAPAPLLKDLLDIVLGNVEGGIGALFGKVGGTVRDFLLPGFATEGELTHFIQAILDDPITAALNLVLGQRDKIECVAEGGISVGESVFEAGVRQLKEIVAAGIG